MQETTGKLEALGELLAILLGTGRFHRFLELNDELFDAIDPAHVFCDVEELPEGGSLAISGRTLTVWEVVEPALAKSLLARGVDLIETFSCDTLIQALAQDLD